MDVYLLGKEKAMKVSSCLILTLYVVMLAGCQPATTGTVKVPIAGAPTSATMPSPIGSIPLPTAIPDLLMTPASSTPEPGETSDPDMQELIKHAKADLAKRLGINMDSIIQVKVQSIEWPDTSLGCPQPDVAYAQIVTPGYIIQLEVQGQFYVYHSDRGENIIMCVESSFPEFPVTPGQIQDGKPWMPVR
jgi:hypothetical protein